MDSVGLHDRAADETARLSTGVRPQQMGQPTLGSDVDVRALFRLAGGTMRRPALAQSEPLMRGPVRGGASGTDLLGDDPASAYRRAAAAVHGREAADHVTASTIWIAGMPDAE